jgi:hypothetical protein
MNGKGTRCRVLRSDAARQELEARPGRVNGLIRGSLLLEFHF